MTTIDAAVKTYKQGLKDSDATLKELESRARELATMEDNRHDAEQAYEEASTELESVAASKENIKDELDEAVRFDDPRTDGLRDEYKELSDREQALRDSMGDAAKAIEDNTPDAHEVARLKSALLNFHAGGSELVAEVERVAQADADALRARSDAAQELLPDVDSLTLLGELGRHSATHKALYENHRQNIEREQDIDPARGQKARDRLDYAVERMLTRA